MKTMKIEKHIVFADKIKEVPSLRIYEALAYHHEMDGIRAIGPLYIQGEIITQGGIKDHFEEILDMDVLAPNAKLTEEPFYLKVDQYESRIDEEGICAYITIMIHGINDGENTEPIKATPVTIPDVAVPLPEINKTPVMEQPMDCLENEDKEDLQSNVQDDMNTSDISEFEDLFEDADTTYTSYRMVVARGNDTYDSIARRYEVELEQLQLINHQKEVHEKTLVILPSTAKPADLS